MKLKGNSNVYYHANQDEGEQAESKIQGICSQ